MALQLRGEPHGALAVEDVAHVERLRVAALRHELLDEPDLLLRHLDLEFPVFERRDLGELRAGLDGLADPQLEVLGEHHAVDRRAQGGGFDVEFDFLARLLGRLGLEHGDLGRGLVGLRAAARALGIGEQAQALLLVLRELRVEPPRVELGDHVALLHMHSLAHFHPLDAAGHLGDDGGALHRGDGAVAVHAVHARVEKDRAQDREDHERAHEHAPAMRAGDGELRIAHAARDSEEGQRVIVLRRLDAPARVQGEELREPRRRARLLRARRAVEESLRRALREVSADEVLVLVQQRRDRGAHHMAQLEIREVDLVRAGVGRRGSGGCLAAHRRDICELRRFRAGEQLFLGKDDALRPGVRADECGHRLHHGTLLFHHLLAGDREHAPVLALLEQDGAALARQQVAPVVRREPGDLQRIERAGEVVGEFQDVLQPVVLHHEIAQPLRLEVLLHMRGEAGEEAREFREILRRDVWLQPHLEDAEHLLL